MNPNAIYDNLPETALTASIKSGASKCVEMLLLRGADPELPNANKLLPLAIAKEHMVDTKNQAQIIQLLDNAIEAKYKPAKPKL